MFPVLLLELGLAAAGASALEAQMPRVAPRPLGAGTPGVERLKQLSSLSAQAEREVERMLTEAAAHVSAAVPMEVGSAKRITLVAAESVADSALALQPTVEALYWYATARGLRADMEGGQDQVDLAAAVYEEAQAILDADPDHAGAHHILGRLHAGVMRLGRIKRFLTVRVLGGGALSDASWAGAEEHFRAAIALEPGRVEHKLELATLLVDTDRPDEARPLLEGVVRAPACTLVVAHFQEKARALLEELGEGR
ncbi:MAG TPA: tetratricopeptide repeat protein [Longimicrobiales bacterium]|nr:tetratricopeptide repeat protein [Longimicrobiales bacterium]